MTASNRHWWARCGLALAVGLGPAGAWAQANTPVAGLSAFSTAKLLTLTPLTFSAEPLASTLARLRGWGWALFPLMLIVGLVLELAVAEHARYGVVVRRAAFVMLLLTFYNGVFGTIVVSLRDMAIAISPPVDLVSQYLGEAEKARDARLASRLAALQAAGAGLGAQTQSLGGIGFEAYVYDALISVVLVVAGALLFVIVLAGQVLLGVMYLVGPLVLPLGIPRASQIASRWFRELLLFASWPLIVALVLIVLSAVGVSGQMGGNLIVSLVAALVLGFSALKVPGIAAALIGGGLAHLGEAPASAAAQKMSSVAKTALQTLGGPAGAAASGAMNVAPSVAGRAGKGGAAGSSPSGSSPPPTAASSASGTTP